ncbi:MAG: hypothetical protein WKF58_03010 [Ilumatobacteraceae bacterium]
MRARHVAGAAAAVVALPWLSVKYAPVAAVLAVGLVWRLGHARQVRHLVSLLAAFAVAGATFAALHHWWYGGWTAYASGSHFRTGELGVVGNPNHLGRSRRLVGLLVDRNFGLVPWQPAALAVVPAIAVLARRRPPGSWLLAGMVAAAWLNATFVALTMHGWWWPGRQIVVIVPLLAVAVAWWVQRLGTMGATWSGGRRRARCDRVRRSARRRALPPPHADRRLRSHGEPTRALRRACAARRHGIADRHDGVADGGVGGRLRCRRGGRSVRR